MTFVFVGNTSVNKNNDEMFFGYLKDDKQIKMCIQILSPILADLHIQIDFTFSSIVNLTIYSCFSFCFTRSIYVKDSFFLHWICMPDLVSVREKEIFHIRWFLLLIPNFNIASQCNSSKSLFLLSFRLSFVCHTALWHVTAEKKKRKKLKNLIRWKNQKREKKWDFFFFSKFELLWTNQRFSFALFLSLSNHSKLSWSMMMVGSALSFDLDASRLIYTSNTWHFLQKENDNFSFLLLFALFL